LVICLPREIPGRDSAAYFTGVIRQLAIGNPKSSIINHLYTAGFAKVTFITHHASLPTGYSLFVIGYSAIGNR